MVLVTPLLYHLLELLHPAGILFFYLLRPFETPLKNLWTIKIHETYRLYPWETLLLALVLLSLFSAPFFFLKQKWSALELRLLRKPTKTA